MPNIIFLDIDGVLVLPRGHCEADPKCVAQLNRITDETGAWLVISSAWKRNYDSLRKKMTEWGITGKRYGFTPFLDAPPGEEIFQWLKDHPRQKWNYVAIDDGEGFECLGDRFVKTNSYKGLTKKDADIVIQLLKGA